MRLPLERQPLKWQIAQSFNLLAQRLGSLAQGCVRQVFEVQRVQQELERLTQVMLDVRSWAHPNLASTIWHAR